MLLNLERGNKHKLQRNHYHQTVIQTKSQNLLQRIPKQSRLVKNGTSLVILRVTRNKSQPWFNQIKERRVAAVIVVTREKRLKLKLPNQRNNLQVQVVQTRLNKNPNKRLLRLKWKRSVQAVQKAIKRNYRLRYLKSRLRSKFRKGQVQVVQKVRKRSLYLQNQNLLKERTAQAAQIAVKRNNHPKKQILSLSNKNKVQVARIVIKRNLQSQKMLKSQSERAQAQVVLIVIRKNKRNLRLEQNEKFLKAPQSHRRKGANLQVLKNLRKDRVLKAQAM